MSPLEAVEAEARTLGPVEVTLRGRTIAVKPAKDWPMSALKDIANQDVAEWARKCLVAKSYDMWLELDPTIGEGEQFFSDYNDASGQDVGKSSASRRSSKSTARR